MTPYGCRGIEGMETPEGDALFQEIWDEVEKSIRPYVHHWQPGDMVLWDNWRMLHEARGCDPKYDRVMHRTTIEGDYGLGRWETPAEDAARRRLGLLTSASTAVRRLVTSAVPWCRVCSN
jgi:taurine dioxygenase